MERLTQQLAFVLELDKLKTILRHTELADGSRRENTAEHSWHAAFIHDVVEIDAGDTLLYDEKGNIDKQEREQKAADRLYGLLPPDQAQELRALWDEYEAAESPEAKFAHAIDRFAPCMLNLASNGSAWVKNGIRYEQAYEKNAEIALLGP
jgi:putative hydrolases of HD superfamily